jgi:hypothetical protein
MVLAFISFILIKKIVDDVGGVVNWVVISLFFITYCLGCHQLFNKISWWCRFASLATRMKRI